MLKQFIYKAEPGRMVHASCLAALPDGRLLCTWFGGSREGAADTEIYFSVGHTVRADIPLPEAGGDESGMHCDWDAPVCLTHEPEACWNPVLLVYHEYVYLFYKTGNRIADWQTKVMVARTDTLFWGEARPLVPGDTGGGRGPVRTKPIILISGRICAGGSVERGVWQSFCDFSDDYGQTWTKSAMLGLNLLTGNAAELSAAAQAPLPDELPPLSPQSFNGRGIIQPVIWQEMNGRLHMYMRSTEGYLFESLSEDDGRTWTDPVATPLFNNNSGFDLIRTPGGSLFLACNPVKGNWGARTPLSLFLGREDGSGWEVFLRVQSGKGEFSYPSLTYTFQGLWCSYTYDRKGIALCFLTWKEIARCRKFRIS